MDSLEVTDAESAAVQKTPHRISLESIKDQIDRVDYYHPEMAPHMTVAFVRCSNGYIAVGKSAPMDPANFNPELGEKFAFEDAVRQLWPLHAFAKLQADLYRHADKNLYP